MILIEKIISGGQTGVDQGALDFAIENGIPCGGWCPKGRLCETGLIPGRYPVTEIAGNDYNQRTLKNVQDSDGTLIIIQGDLKEKGTELTKTFCEQYGKPFLVLDIKQAMKAGSLKKEFTNWIKLSGIRILNVAGNRESSSPGIHAETKELLRLFILKDQF